MINAVRGNNFSGKSFYLKCFAAYPEPKVIKAISDQQSLLRDPRRSIYLGPIGEYGFTGVFDKVWDEVFRLRPLSQSVSGIHQLMEDVDLDEHVNQNPYTLSGGEKALVSVLGSIMMLPKNLAIDCTLEQLDQRRKRRIIEFLNNSQIPEVMIADNRMSELKPALIRVVKHDFLEEDGGDHLKLQPITAHNFHISGESERTTLGISRLNFSYGRKVIFKALSLELETGKVYRLRGENGAGKSTLAKLLTGVLKLGKNSKLSINGVEHDPYKIPGKYVGYSAQQPDEQLFSTSVRRELSYGSDDTMTDVLLQSFGLQEVMDVHPFDLPLVIRKRLAIAATLSVNRPFYILDEPTLFLDDKSMVQLKKIMDRLVANGKGIIFISHSETFSQMFDNTIDIIL